MIEFTPEDKSGKRILFTPGPLTTTRTVREAMLIDTGSRDVETHATVREIREGLLEIVGGRDDLTVTLQQGSGSFGVETMIQSSVPADGKLLVLINGAYGRRIAQMAEKIGLNFVKHIDPEDTPHDPAKVDALLEADKAITHVAVIACETTTGLLNPIAEIGKAIQKHGRHYLVDAISIFGASRVGPGQYIDFDAGPIDHLVGSSNKCNEAVPGFSFIFSRREAMERAKGVARSHVLDLYDQWRFFEDTGNFRFTPATHVLLAFRQALRELEAEGGVAAREKRYKAMHGLLIDEMEKMGFHSLIKPEHQSCIISTFLLPWEGFDHKRLYNELKSQGLIIYPGKLTIAETFRIGSIGSIGVEEMQTLLDAIQVFMAQEEKAGRVPAGAAT